MTNFSGRHGYGRNLPPRTMLEAAPDDLRSLLREILADERGPLGGYKILCGTLHRVPDPDIWSDQGASEEFSRLLGRLEWFEVFDLLEEHGGNWVDEINDSFARCGLAYEAHGTFSHGVKIEIHDPESAELEVSAIEDDAVGVLTGKYQPVLEQYQRALSALRCRPADDEKAISESLGAVEAVARILGGGKDFGANIDKLFLKSPAWAKALAASLKALYGYGSQVPGARHGRYTDPLLAHEDALYVVRVCGCAISYLAAGDRSARWN